MEKIKKPTRSHASIAGIFVVLVLFLSVPLALLSTQQNQDIRQRAAQILPSPDLLQPLSANGHISGYVYFDKNKDGERNYAEESLAGIQIKVTQVNQDINQVRQANNLTFTLVSDENGFFKYKFPEGGGGTYSFNLQLMLPEGYKTINTNPRLLNNISSDAREVVEFGVFAISEF